MGKIEKLMNFCIKYANGERDPLPEDEKFSQLPPNVKA